MCNARSNECFRNLPAKFTIAVRALLACILFISLELSAAGSQNTGVEISVGEWPPYIDSNKVNEGIATEVVQKALKNSAIESKIVFKTWRRVEFDVDHNGAFSFGWIRTEEREKKWRFSKPIMQGKTVIAVLKGRALIWKTLADLKPFTLATAAGYSYGDEFDGYKKNLKIFENNDEITSLRMLLMNRIDLVVIDPLVAQSLLEGHFASEASRVYFVENPPIKLYDLHMVCARDNPACEGFISRFDKSLDQLAGDDEIAAILRRNFVE